MADTFSNDLRLRLQESGSNAGTWGDLLNGTITNIASALGQGSEAIPNASTHTITLADGVADEARSLYLKCTGGGQACTVTLGPNTISKVWIIDNATSYTLTFSQGSGANVAIAAGAVKVIATDGAGSGAAVVDTLDGLEGSFSTLAVTGEITANGGIALGDSDKATFGASDDLQIYHDGINSYIDDAGSGYLLIRGAAQTRLSNADSSEDYFIGVDGAQVELSYAGSTKLATTSTGIDVTGSVTMDGLISQATANTYTAGAAQIKSLAGDISYITNVGGDFLISNSSTTDQFTLSSAGSVGIGTSSPSSALHVDSSNDGPIFDSGGTGNTNHALLVRDSANNQLLRVNNNGNVGIGVSNPSDYYPNNLVVTGPSEGGITIASTGNHTNYINFADSASGVARYAGMIEYAHSIDAMSFRTNSIQRMRLDASGNLLVGSTTNYGKFVVENGGNNYPSWFRNTSSSIDYPNRIMSNYATGGQTATMLQFLNAGAAAVGAIKSTASATSYVTSSDQRLKENIADADDAGSKIDSIQVRKFDWIADGSHQDYGMVAQELQAVAPEAVSGDADSEEMMGVDYSKLVPMLVKEIQSLRSRVAELENN